MRLFLSLSLLAAIPALALALDPAQPRFGSRFCMFNTTSWIREINTTLVVPPLPSPPTDELALWPGIEVPGGGLTQSVIRSFQDPGPHCNATGDQWCGAASALAYPSQAMGQSAPISVGDHVFFHYLWDNASGNYTQTLYRNGEIISTFSYNTGKGQTLDVAVEVHGHFAQKVASHSYYNTSIVLDQADPGWASRAGAVFHGDQTGKTSSAGNPGTFDGGVTWEIPEIHVFESEFPLLP